MKWALSLLSHKREKKVRWQPGDVGADGGDDRAAQQGGVHTGRRKHHQIYTSEEAAFLQNHAEWSPSIIRPSPHRIGLRARLRSV